MIYAENPTAKLDLVLFYILVGASKCYMFLLFIHSEAIKILPELEISEDSEDQTDFVAPTESSQPQSQPGSQSPELVEDPFGSFADHFGLTGREKDVCRRLLFTEDSGQKMADDLYISRRVFQRHVASIYEKTDTKSRMGLFKVYNNGCF